MAEMMQWEYQVATIGGALKGINDEELQSVLNEWGNDGWEVIGVYAIENSNKVRAVARRMLTTASRRQRSMPSY